MRLLMWSAVRDELIVEGSPMESLHNRDSRLGLVFVLWGVGSLIWLEKIFSRGENLSDLLLSSQDAHHNTLLVFNIWCAMRIALICWCWCEKKCNFHINISHGLVKFTMRQKQLSYTENTFGGNWIYCLFQYLPSPCDWPECEKTWKAQYFWNP